MNVFKRATISMKRRLSKTIILLLLVFILGTIIAGALSIEGAVANTKANLRHQMRPIVSFKTDLDALNDYYDGHGVWPLNPTLSPEIIRQIAELPYVSQVNDSVFANIQTNQLQVPNLGMGNDKSDLIFLFVRGTSETTPLLIREGVIEIAEGRVFTETELSLSNESHPIIISRGMAEVNHLSVDSKFNFDIHVYSPQLDAHALDWHLSEDNLFASETFLLEVIGIFDNEAATSENEIEWSQQMLIQEHSQTIFTTNATAEAFQVFQAENHAAAFEEQLEITGLNADDFPWYQTSDEIRHMATAVMELTGVNEIEAFKDAVAPLLPPLMEVEDLTNSFSSISSSMENLKETTNWILLMTIGSSLLILSLLIILFLRERRYEMGVYLSLGERKSKIISQLFIEIILPTVVGITLAIFSGHVVSSVLSRSMLRRELVSAQQLHPMNVHFDPDSLSALGFPQEMTPDEMIEAFHISLDVGTIGLFYLIGGGIIIFSMLVPMLYILTSDPNKVLT